MGSSRTVRRRLIQNCRNFDIFDALRGQGIFEVGFSRTKGGTPSEEQVAACKFFLQHAASCENASQALLRDYQRAREQEPDWFDPSDCPEGSSIAELAPLATVDGVTFNRRSCEGLSLVSIGWNVEWDVEHGLEMTVWKDQVIAIGAAGEDPDFEDAEFSLWNRSHMTPAEREHLERVAACAADFEEDDDFDEEE